MTAPTVSVQYEDLKAIASHFDHHAQEIIKVYRFIANQVHELRTEYWVGDNADIFYTSMDSDILPALSRLQQALAEGGDTTRDIIAIFQQAEEDGAAVFSDSGGLSSDMNLSNLGKRAVRNGVSAIKANSRSDSETGIPPAPPPPLPPATGDGSGIHGMAADDITDDHRAVWSKMRDVAYWAEKLGFLGFGRTGSHMLHYLRNTGDPLLVNVNHMLNDIELLRQGVDRQFQREIIPQIQENLDALGPITEPIQFTVETNWTSDVYPNLDSERDWYYAMGGFSYSQTGLVTVSPNSDGESLIVSIESQVHVFDRYNWDEGKSVTIPSADSLLGTEEGTLGFFNDISILGDHVSDGEMGLLHQVGLAQEYDIHGTSDVEIHIFEYGIVSLELTDVSQDHDGGR
jgi:WXG100 family type VII secretion target